MENNLPTYLNRMYSVLAEIAPRPLVPEGMHGALAAVALSPYTAVPNTWLPILYNMQDELPEFTSRESAKTFLDTAVSAYNLVVTSLTTGEFAFTFEVKTTADEHLRLKLKDWCEGFIKGFRGTGVETTDFDEDFISLMSPIAYCARPEFFAAEVPEPNNEQAYRRIADEMDANLQALRNYLFLFTQRQQMIRNTDVPGRNDPCPCGSGKKYKQCCGRS